MNEDGHVSEGRIVGFVGILGSPYRRSLTVL
jgi:hypothetical protein